MNRVGIQFKREFSAYFMTPMGFVVMTIVLLFAGFFFTQWVIFYRIGTYQLMIQPLTMLNWIIGPVIAMRLIAEEKRSGTFEALMTAPVKEWEIVLAKYLGAIFFYAVLYLPTLLYLVILFHYADEPKEANRPEILLTLSAYAGLLLSGWAFISIGLFVSTLTRHQIVAAIVTFLALIVLWALGFAAQTVGGWLGSVLLYINFFDHVESFGRGIISTKDVFYFLSLIGFFLFLSHLSLVQRR